jgi:hypothetical protein
MGGKEIPDKDMMFISKDTGGCKALCDIDRNKQTFNG